MLRKGVGKSRLELESRILGLAVIVRFCRKRSSRLPIQGGKNFSANNQYLKPFYDTFSFTHRLSFPFL